MRSRPRPRHWAVCACSPHSYTASQHGPGGAGGELGCVHSRPQPGPCRHPYSFQALLSVSRGHGFGERASSGAQERSGLPSGPPTSQQGGRVCHPSMVCGFQQLHLFLSLQEAPRQHPETSTRPQGRPLQARLGSCPNGALLRFPTLESR